MPLNDSALPPGTTIGSYVVEERIGAGASGTVYRARHHGSQREVALKVLREVGGGENVRGRFLREAQVLASLSHPYVAAVLDASIEPVPHIAMELVRGRSLWRWILERQPLEPSLLLMAGIAEALAHVHARGIVHRDLKPANVLVQADGSPKLVDFGVSRSAVREERESFETVLDLATLTRPGQLVGTVSYMSPEQALGRHIDVRSDIFAFGILLYEVLSGRHPFRQDSPPATLIAILRHPAPPLELPGHPELAQLVASCLAKDAADRSSDCARIAQVLRESAARVPEPAPASRAEPAPVRVPMLGRDAERDAALRASSQPGSVLVISGPAGSGKSRLALEVAIRWQERHSLEFRVAELEGTRTRAELLSRLAPQLGCDPSGAGPEELAERIGQALAARRIGLLVLDPLDLGVGEASGPIDLWRRRAPGLCILAAGNARIGVEGEQHLSLGPLPDGAATEIFLRAARLGPEQRDLAERLARRADGNPLAILLSAAQAAELGPEALEDDTLRDEARTSPLVQAIAACYVSLSAAEQKAVRRLSLMASGFDAESLDAITSEVGGQRETLVDALRRRALLLVHERSTGRVFRLPEAVQRYGRSEMERLGEVEEAKTGIVARAEARSARYRGGARALPASWADDRALVVDAARAVLGAAQPGPALVRDALSAVAALCVEAADRGGDEALFELLESLRARSAAEPPALSHLAWGCLRLDQSPALAAEAFAWAAERARATDEAWVEVRARCGAASAAIIRGREDEAEAQLRAAIALAGERGLSDARAGALERMASLRWSQSRPLEALALLDEAVEHMPLDDHPVCVLIGITRGLSLMELRRLDEARACFEHTRELAERHERGRMLPIVLNNLGYTHQELGDIESARGNYVQALVLAHESGLRRVYAVLHINLAWLFFEERRNLPRARSLVERALETLEELGDVRHRRLALAACAIAAAEALDVEAAQEDVARAEALGEAGEELASAALALARVAISIAVARRTSDPAAVDASRQAGRELVARFEAPSGTALPLARRAAVIRQLIALLRLSP